MFPETSNDSSIIHCVDSHMAVKPKQKKKKGKEKRLLSASNLQVSQVQASQLQYIAKYFQDSFLTLSS